MNEGRKKHYWFEEFDIISNRKKIQTPVEAEDVDPTSRASCIEHNSIALRSIAQHPTAVRSARHVCPT